MAVIVKTNHSEEILNTIRKLIVDGMIDEWSYDEDGDFTLVGNMHNKAWFSPTSSNHFLLFNIIGRNGTQMELTEYSIYHGKLVDLLIHYCYDFCLKIIVTKPLDHSADCHDINL